MKIITRQPRAYEKQELCHIWKTAFGGVDADTFFGFYYDPERCLVADEGGIPVSMGHLLPAGNIILGSASFPCAMIYAVATLPRYRGKGLAAAVVRELVSIGRDAGYKAIVLCPTEDSLFEYYSTCTVFQEWFFVSEEKFASAPPVPRRVELKEIDAVEYLSIRETLLKGIPHIDPGLKALEYQRLLCRLFGGGLFRFENPRGVSCAVVEKQSNGAVCVKELLTPDGDTSDVISAIASTFPAAEYIVRSPSLSGSAGTSVTKRFGMIAAPDGLFDAGSAVGTLPWYGLAFD